MLLRKALFHCEYNAPVEYKYMISVRLSISNFLSFVLIITQENMPIKSYLVHLFENKKEALVNTISAMSQS